jgi:hypothetical protein
MSRGNVTAVSNILLNARSSVVVHPKHANPSQSQSRNNRFYRGRNNDHTTTTNSDDDTGKETTRDTVTNIALSV